MNASKNIDKLNNKQIGLIIDLDAIDLNYKSILSIVLDINKVYFVLKSDAYGHGLNNVCKVLMNNNCKNIALISLDEALKVRKLGFKGNILILKPISSNDIIDAVKSKIILAVNNPDQILELSEYAKNLNITTNVYINLDSGLYRNGMSIEDSARLIKALKKSKRIIIDGILTHPRSLKTVKNDLNKLLLFKQSLIENNININYTSFADSATFLSYARAMDYSLRLGILLYGIYPPKQKGYDFLNIKLKPVMSLKTKITQINIIKKGISLGYQNQKKVKNNSLIGTIPLGYKNGIDRKFISKKCNALVHGKRVFFIGSVFMNSALIDLSTIDNPKIGDDVVILGDQLGEKIFIEEIADKLGTIPAEIMVRFGQGNDKIFTGSVNG